MAHLPFCRTGLPAVLLAACVCAAPDLAAQSLPPFRVQLHVSADNSIKPEALTVLRTALQPVRDIAIVERDGEYVMSVLILRTIADSYMASMAVMNVHTAGAVDDLARRWRLEPAARQQAVSMFGGSGALVDQRIMTARTLQELCEDMARVLNADTLGAVRRARPAP